MLYMKYRTKWAGGYGPWEYRPLSTDEESPQLEERIQEFIRETNEDYEYSDKYRGVAYTLLDRTSITLKELDAIEEEYIRVIVSASDTLNRTKDFLKAIHEGLTKFQEEHCV